MRYATVYGCSDATIVLGAVGKVAISMHLEIGNVFGLGKWNWFILLGANLDKPPNKVLNGGENNMNQRKIKSNLFYKLTFASALI